MGNAEGISLKRRLFDLIPANHQLYHFCKRYVDFYSGENNQNMLTNGELRFMRQVLPQCNVVFDVGANIGDWTALALRINPQLTIHCFEPGWATYQHLLAREFPSSVTCNDLGLGSRAEQRTLYVFEDGAGINSLYRRSGLESFGLTTQRYEEAVQLATLDEYCRKLDIQTIDYLKVDVEGHELEVFEGATHMLENGQIMRIQFEYGGACIDARVLLKDLFESLQKFGYTLHKIYPRELRRVEQYDQRFENFQYQNWVAISSSYSL